MPPPRWGLRAEAVQLAAATDQVRVFQGEVEERKWRILHQSRRRPVRAVDREGVIRVQRSDGVVLGATAQTGLAQLRRLLGRGHDLQRRQRHHARHVHDRRPPRGRPVRRERSRAGPGDRPQRAGRTARRSAPSRSSACRARAGYDRPHHIHYARATGAEQRCAVPTHSGCAAKRIGGACVAGWTLSRPMDMSTVGLRSLGYRWPVQLAYHGERHRSWLREYGDFCGVRGQTASYHALHPSDTTPRCADRQTLSPSIGASSEPSRFSSLTSCITISTACEGRMR